MREATAPGYYDPPGLAAWTIGLSTTIFGESVLGVRLLTLLAGAATPAFVFLAGRRLHDEKVGRLAAFLTALVPLLFSFGSMAGAGRFTERGFDPRKLLAFPASQFLLLTPFAGLWAWGPGLRTLARWRSSCWPDRFLAALSMAPLLFFAGVTFIRPVRGHWAAAGYPGGLLLAAAAAARGARGPFLLAFVPRERLRGWSVLASEVRKLDPQFVLAHDHHPASQMACPLRPLPSFEFTPPGRPPSLGGPSPRRRPGRAAAPL